MRNEPRLTSVSAHRRLNLKSNSEELQMKRQPQLHYTRAASASRHAACTTRDDSSHVLRVYNFAVSSIYPARSNPANCGENKNQDMRQLRRHLQCHFLFDFSECPLFVRALPLCLCVLALPVCLALWAMRASDCLPVCLSVLSVCSSVCQSVCLFVYLSIYLPIYE